MTEPLSVNIGFCNMANAGGPLAGAVLSGRACQTRELEGSQGWSAGFVLLAALLSFKLPEGLTSRKGQAGV